MFSLSGIMAGQSLSNHEIKELHHTIKQIAAAKGIKIETIEETRNREEYARKFQAARNLGVSVEEYECMVATTATENFVAFIAACIIGFVVGAFIGDYVMKLSVGISWFLGIICWFIYYIIKPSKYVSIGVILLFIVFIVLGTNGLL